MDYKNPVECIYIHIYSMEYYSVIKKNDVICNNMDEPKESYPKWNK